MKSPEDGQGYLFSKNYSNYVFILLFLLYLFDYADRMVVNSMFTFIEAEWNITDTQCGWLVSVIYLAIGLLTFPVSFLIDQWSRTKTIGIMAIIWSLATALCALTGNYVQLLMARILIGFGEAGYAPGGSALISGATAATQDVIHPGLRATSYAIAVAVQNLLGSFTAPIILGKISDLSNIKTAMAILPFVLLIGSLLFYVGSSYYLKDLSKIADVKLEIVK